MTFEGLRIRKLSRKKLRAEFRRAARTIERDIAEIERGRYVSQRTMLLKVTQRS